MPNSGLRIEVIYFLVLISVCSFLLPLRCRRFAPASLRVYGVVGQGRYAPEDRGWMTEDRVDGA